MRKLAAILFALLISSTALAVDGHKDFKFGMSKKAVKQKLGKSAFEKDGCIASSDYDFGGQKRIAVFFFDNKGLGRIAITIERRELQSTVKALLEKYGTASSTSTTEEWGQVDEYPDKCAQAGFDGDTVVVRVCSNSKMQQAVYLVYTTPEFGSQQRDEGMKKLKDDL